MKKFIENNWVHILFIGCFVASAASFLYLINHGTKFPILEFIFFYCIWSLAGFRYYNNFFKHYIFTYKLFAYADDPRDDSKRLTCRDVIDIYTKLKNADIAVLYIKIAEGMSEEFGVEVSPRDLKIDLEFISRRPADKKK